MGSGLHLQFAMTFWLAVAAALAAFVVLLSTHVLLRRSDYVDDLRREVARLEARLGRPSAPPTRQPAAAPQGAAAPELSPAALVLPPRREPAPAGPVATMEEYWGFAPATGIAAPAFAPAVPAVDAITEAIAKLPAAEASKLPAAETSMLPDAEALAPPPVASTPHADAPHSRDADADKINEVIKKLAADITQGQALLGRDSVAGGASDDDLPAATPVEPLATVAVGAPPPDVDDSVAGTARRRRRHARGRPCLRAAEGRRRHAVGGAYRAAADPARPRRNRPAGRLGAGADRSGARAPCRGRRGDRARAARRDAAADPRTRRSPGAALHRFRPPARRLRRRSRRTAVARPVRAGLRAAAAAGRGEGRERGTDRLAHGGSRQARRIVLAIGRRVAGRATASSIGSPTPTGRATRSAAAWCCRSGSRRCGCSPRCSGRR